MNVVHAENVRMFIGGQEVPVENLVYTERGALTPIEVKKVEPFRYECSFTLDCPDVSAFETLLLPEDKYAYAKEVDWLARSGGDRQTKIARKVALRCHLLSQLHFVARTHRERRRLRLALRRGARTIRKLAKLEGWIR